MKYRLLQGNTDGLVQECNNFCKLAMELLQSCIKLSIQLVLMG